MKMDEIDSRSVAEHFDKRHADVLRMIEAYLSRHPELTALRWFRRAEYRDRQGKSRPCFEMTISGFRLLIGGLTGPRAIEWRIRFAQALVAMQDGNPTDLRAMLSGFRMEFASLAA